MIDTGILVSIDEHEIVLKERGLDRRHRSI